MLTKKLGKKEGTELSWWQSIKNAFGGNEE
jgi:hypothetical protein